MNSPLSALLIFLAGCGGKLAPAPSLPDTSSTGDASIEPISAGSGTPDATSPISGGEGDAGDATNSPDGPSNGDAGLGDTLPCLAGGNLLSFDGPSFTSPQSLLVSDATWTVSGSMNDEEAWLGVVQGQAANTTVYGVELSSEGLGTPLQVGLYENAGRAPFVVAGQPSMDVSGGGVGCNTLEGSFRLDVLDWDSDGGIREITAAFEEVCDGETANPIRGCVHYAAP